MKIFPYVLARISGGTFDNLEALDAQKSNRILDEMFVIEKNKAYIQSRIVSELYELISLTQTPEERAVLIELKRNVYNGRRVSAETLDSVISIVTGEVEYLLRQYFSLTQELDCLVEEGEKIFDNEIKASRSQLRALVAKEALQKGLVLSSQSLLKYGVQRYVKNGSSELRKHELQAERNLLKYIARIYAKTSPYSTFTNLAIKCLFVDEDKPNRSSDVSSHVRLNNDLCKYFINLLSETPSIHKYFLVRLNPTLRREGDYYVCLVNDRNIEAFQRILATPAIELFIDLLSDHREGKIYNDIVRTIIENQYLDASLKDVEAYLYQLIEIGFLEFNIGISGLDPNWDELLQKKLKRLANDIPLVKELIESIQHVQSLSNQFGVAGINKRLKILEEAHYSLENISNRFKQNIIASREDDTSDELQDKSRLDNNNGIEDSIFRRHHLLDFDFEPERIYFEDTSITEYPKFNEAQLSQLISIVHDLFQSTRRLESRLDEQDKMKRYFVEEYGEESSVDLLAFYEDFYREVKLPETKLIERIKKESKTTPDEYGKKYFISSIPEVSAREELNQAWLKYLSSVIRKQVGNDSPNVINITLEQITKANDAVPYSEKDDCRTSHSIFIQLFMETTHGGKEELMGVLNGGFPGFGKMMSRFLYLFDETVSVKLRQYIASLNEDELFVEDCDSSVFNANMHPPLLPFEIQLPNGQNSLPIEQQIPVTDIAVRLNEEKDEICLFHKPTGKRIYIFDVTLMALSARSQLFQLLEKFTLAETPVLFRLIKFVSNQYLSDMCDGNVLIAPRVVFENRIVLQRKTWYIKKGTVPVKQHQESDWSYFSRLNNWRYELGMPNDIFIVVNDMTRIAEYPPENYHNIDSRKPQYISFKNPLLVNLFERLIHEVSKELTIVEMLPDPTQLLEVTGKRRVTEFVVEWYTYGNE